MLTAITAVATVLTFSALLGWLLLRASTSVERARRDPAYRRLLLLVHGATAAAGVVACFLLTAGMRLPAPRALQWIVMGLLNVVSFINLARVLRAPRV